MRLQKHSNSDLHMHLWEDKMVLTCRSWQCWAASAHSLWTSKEIMERVRGNASDLAPTWVIIQRETISEQ